MFDSIYADRAIVRDLEAIHRMGSWRANAAEIGIYLALHTQNIPDPLFGFLLNILRAVGPLFTDEVMSKWKAAANNKTVVLYADAAIITLEVAFSILVGLCVGEDFNPQASQSRERK